MIERITSGRFSTITRLSTKALRLYDERGILSPERDPVNNYRYYTLAQVEDGIKIRMMAEMGFSLEEISEVMGILSHGDLDELDDIFMHKSSQIEREITRLKRLRNLIQSYNPIEVLYMSCSEPEIKQITGMRVLSRREKGRYSQVIGKLIGELMTELQRDENRGKVHMTGPVMFISHDREYREEADIEIAIPISGRISLSSDEYEVKRFPELRAVSLVYTGPYHEIGAGYSRAMNYVAEKGLAISGNIREIYLNDPQRVEESQLMTEIQIPVEVQG